MAKRTTRGSPINPDVTLNPLAVLEERYEAGVGPWHAHQRAQLLHAGEGVLSVETASGRWVVPPQRTVWILPTVRHRVASARGYTLRALYASPDALPLPSDCCVVAIEPLVDELLKAAALLRPDHAFDAPAQRLFAVIVDRLQPLRAAPLKIAMPEDPRLKRLATLIVSNPGDQRTLNDFAQTLGASTKTITRLFTQETGQTFIEWRQQVRLLTALERLGFGRPVTTVALEVGYHDVSSFITAFKAAFGTTPAKYFAVR